MSKRVCNEPGCPNTFQPHSSGKCPACRRKADRARGTTSERGYGSDHVKLRAEYQRRMDQGERFVCWRPDCSRVINPRAWHLGHDDHDRNVYRGPECVPCNTRTASRRISQDAYPLGG